MTTDVEQADVSDGDVLTTRDDRLLIVSLNRPERLNALTPHLMRRLRGTLEDAAADSSIGAVVLTGEGRAFCAGGDFKRRQKVEEERLLKADTDEAPPARTFEQEVGFLRRGGEISRLLHEMPKPTIAMINGACAGAGLSMAGACDLRFAGESAVFVSAFVGLDVSGDFGGSWFWPRIVGEGRAKELFYLSERITSEKALAYGMVSHVFPDAELREQTITIARRLSGLASPRFMKANFVAARSLALSDHLGFEAANHMRARRARE